MPLVDNTHYVDSVGHAAVTAWAVATAKTVGNFVRATAPAVNSERIFVCIVAGTTHATTQPTWVNTRGAKTTDNTITWMECTGLSGTNGDVTNTPSWDDMKAVTSTGVLGQLIKNNAASHYFIMTTAGTIGASQPSFSTTTGATTADNTATWTCLGAVGSFTGNMSPHKSMFNVVQTGWGGPGNTIYIKSSHANSQAAFSVAGFSTLALPQRFLCHDGGAYPPAAANLTTGASETSTGNMSLNMPGAYVEGMSFTCSAAGTTLSAGTAGTNQRFKNCTFVKGSTTGSIILGNNSTAAYSSLVLESPVFSFANAAHTINSMNGNVTIHGGSLAGAAVPTSLLSNAVSGTHFTFQMFGTDLSAAGSGKTLVAASTNMSGLFRFVDCKLGASVTPAATPTAPQVRVEFINCNSGAINYDTSIYDYTGTLTTETGVVRSGGASDGTTPISWKVITTANASFDFPFECPPISIWNETTGSAITATIEGIWGGGAVPDDDDIWVEVMYLGSATPVASRISDAKATVLTTAAAQTSSSETWGGSTTAFKLGVTFTPQMKGFVYARVKCGAASSTFYIDPKITLT